MSSVFDKDFDPSKVDGPTLAQNVATVGKPMSITLEADVYDRTKVEVTVVYRMSSDDWDFALEHAQEKGE